jgi:hypothetical protein
MSRPKSVKRQYRELAGKLVRAHELLAEAKADMGQVSAAPAELEYPIRVMLDVALDTAQGAIVFARQVIHNEQGRTP